MTARVTGAHSILVVDDDDAIRTLVMRILTRAGYRVTQASDGSVAIAAMREQNFDAIVLDMMMPRVSGFEVLTYIRAHHDGRRCVVISSAAVHALSPEDAALVSATIRKPFDLETLLAAVAGCIA